MKIKEILDLFLYFLLLPLVSISFILTPSTNDSRIFLGAGAIADKYYSLPYGWDAAYEVKPIMNRILNWGLYKVANVFVPFEQNHYTEFGIAIKVLALIILILCCWYISKKISFPYSFPIIYLCFICQANFGIIMSEWFAVLFSLVAVALCMEEREEYTFAAGVVMVGVGLLKSITSLVLIPVICAVWLLNKKLRIGFLLSGCLVASCTFFIACMTIFPYSINDMLMSRLIAHVGMYDFTTLIQWFFLTQTRMSLPVTMMMYIPGVIAGGLASVFVLANYSKFDGFKKVGVLCLMWLIPINIVLIQSEFVVYHYIVMLFPAIISMALLFRNGGKKVGALMIIFLLIMIPGYVMINSSMGLFTTYEYTFWHQKERNADEINSQFNLTNQSTLLYLDPGDAPFYFHANSSCHYITPMPIERSTDRWNISHLPQYSETYNCILNYQGEYIVGYIRNPSTSHELSLNYFGEGISIRKDIINKIDTEYELVSDKSWEIYKKRVTPVT